MKVKRIISALVAVMLVLSCFAVSASADAIFDSSKDLKFTIEYKTTDGVAITGAKFKITGQNTGYTAEKEIPASGSVTFTKAEGLVRDRYTVEQTVKGNAQTESQKITSFVVDVPDTTGSLDEFNYNVVAKPKGEITTTEPKISKAVSDHDGGYGQSTPILSVNASNAYWRIVVTTPELINTYTKFNVTDFIDNRLENTSLNSVQFVKGDTTVDFEAGTDYTGGYDAVSNKITIMFNATGISKMQGNGEIIIKFTNQIDLDQANTVRTPIGNHTTLTFTNSITTDKIIDNTPNNPDDDIPTPDPTKPETYPEDDDFPREPDPTDPTKPSWPTNPGDTEKSDDPYIWTGDFSFVKIKKGTTTTLTGAEFELYSDAAGANKLGDFTETSGTYSIAGLTPGTYYIKETKAPAGYELIGVLVPFTVADVTSIAGVANATGKFAPTAADTVAAATETAFNFTDTTASTNYLVNIPSVDLPGTGAEGAYVYAFIGLALAVIGVAVFMRSKKTAV